LQQPLMTILHLITISKSRKSL